MKNQKPQIIIAADFGTSAVKIAVFDQALKLVDVESRNLTVSYPARDQAEQNPLDWSRALQAGLKALFARNPKLKRRTSCLVFGAQMCGVVATAEDGTPLRPCLIWLDKRASPLIRQVMGGFPSLAGFGLFKLLRSIYHTNGAPSLNGMDPLAKMMWLKQHEPQIWGKTHKLLDVKDWLLHWATGQFVTTADSANLTWMMSSRNNRAQWSSALAGTYGIPLRLLPDIVPGNSIIGGLSKDCAKFLGLPANTPVIAGCGDVCAAAIGSGATRDGELHISLGTSSWIGAFFNGRRLNATASYATIVSPLENRPLLIASQESAGSCLSWLHNISGKFEYPDGDRAPPLFLPWLAGERVPVDDSQLRGAFLGLSLAHGKADLYRSVVEGVALNTRWAFQSVSKQKGVLKNVPIPVVGGAARDDNLCQSLADCLGAELIRHESPQFAGVRGLSVIAAAAMGDGANVWDIANQMQLSAKRDVFSPRAEKAGYYDKRFALFIDAHRRASPWFKKAIQSGVFGDD